MIIPIKNIFVKMPNYIIATLVIIITYFLFTEKFLHKHKKIINYFFYFGLILYLLLLYEIMFGLSGGLKFNRPRHKPNLYPLINIFNVYNMGFLNMLKQVSLNIIITIPLGFLLPAIFLKLRSSKNTIFFILIISILIETLQYFVGRSADIDDVIMYILGGFIGYFLFKLFTEITQYLKK